MFSKMLSKLLKKMSLLISISILWGTLLIMLSSCGGDNSGIAPTQSSSTTTENVLTPLTLSEGGNSEYVVVVSESATESEQYAASQFATYFHKITGVLLPFVYDEDNERPMQEKEIVIGKTNREEEGEFDRKEFGDDGFVIKTKGEKLYIVGGEKRGTLYGVYTFLEKYLGCRYFTDDCEYVPTLPTVEILPIEEDKQIPVITYRDVYWQCYFPEDISVKQKLNGSQNRRISEKKGGTIEYASGLFVHTLGGLLGTGGMADATPCLSAEGVYETVLENVRKALEADPDGKIVSISQGDSLKRCQCETCKMLEEKHGSGMATVLLLVNRVADALKDEFPDVMFDTLAYHQTLDPPKNLRANDNVIVRLCTILCCQNHPLEKCDIEFYDKNEEDHAYAFAENLRQWGELCDNLHVWDYTTDFNAYQTPFPDFWSIRENVRFYAENNVTGIFAQGNGNDVSGEFGELRAYLLSKLLWNPYMSEEEYYGHMNDFLQGYYGEGWESIRAYIDLEQKASENTHFECFSDPLKIIPPVYTENLNPLPSPEISNQTDWLAYADNKTVMDMTFINTAKALFDQAEAAVTDETHLAHIQRSRVQILYYEITLLHEKYGKRMEAAIAEVVSPEDLKTALAYAATQKADVIVPLHKQFREEIDRFGIERWCETAEYGEVQLWENEPKYWWSSEILVYR